MIITETAMLKQHSVHHLSQLKRSYRGGTIISTLQMRPSGIGDVAQCIQLVIIRVVISTQWLSISEPEMVAWTVVLH